jgi:hypothetical protein
MKAPDVTRHKKTILMNRIMIPFFILPLTVPMILPSFLGDNKTESSIHFGNPAVFKLYRLFRYGGSANDPAIILTQLRSHSQVPHLGFKDPWLSVPSSRMV